MVNDVLFCIYTGRKVEILFDLRFTIRTFVEALVCFHVESHVTLCALEARLVPCLK